METTPETRQTINALRDAYRDVFGVASIRGLTTPAIESEAWRSIHKMRLELEAHFLSKLDGEEFEASSWSLSLLRTSHLQPYYAVHFHDPPSVERSSRRVVVRTSSSEFTTGYIFEAARAIVPSQNSWSVVYEGRSESVWVHEHSLICQARAGLPPVITLPPLEGAERLEKKPRTEPLKPGRREFDF